MNWFCFQMLILLHLSPMKCFVPEAWQEIINGQCLSGINQKMCRQLAGLKEKKRLPICLQSLKGYFSNSSTIGSGFFNNKLRDGSNSTRCFVYELHLPFFAGGLVVGWLVFSHCFSRLTGQHGPNLCGVHGKQLW